MYEEKLNNSISSLLFLIVPICFGLMVVAKEVIALYGGDKYVAATIPLIMICVVRLFVSLESVMNHLVLYPNDKENRILKVSFVCGLINLSLNYLLVLFKVLTPFTAIITTGIAEIVMFFWHYTYTRKIMKINVRVFTKQNITYLVLGMLFIPISLIIRLFDLSFMITLGLIVMVCALLYISVLFIKKDNNFIFIISKFKRKVIGK